MRAPQRTRLAQAGWKTGSTADFLSLTPEESAFVEMKLGLSQALRRWRTRKQLTQGELAEALGSSQSRVARMEAADSSVSVDLLVRSLLKLGATRRDIARALG
jgi:predicted XRE-type DNA-binding protein